VVSALRPPSTQVCFICMEEGRADAPLVNSVCHCANRPMHLACQRELTSKTPAHAGGYCAVCNAPYTNVRTTSKTALSPDGRKCVFVSVGTLLLMAIGGFEVSMYFAIGTSHLQVTYLVLGLVILAVALIFVSCTPTPTLCRTSITSPHLTQTLKCPSPMALALALTLALAPT